jgi:hypothetical protein
MFMISKEAVVTYFKLVTRNWFGKQRGSVTEHSQGGRQPREDSNLVPTKINYVTAKQTFSENEAVTH